MSKTNEPHSDSYFAFACLVLEQAADTEQLLPWWAPPDCFAPWADHIGEPLLRHHARRHRAATRELHALERQRLIDLGLGPTDVSSLAAEAFLAENVNRRLTAASFKWPNYPAPRFCEGSYRPRRDTIAGVITGHHLAFGNGRRSTTAKRLNRGIATRDKAYGITPNEVRNALQSFVNKYLTSYDRTMLRAASARFHAQATELLWAELPKCSVDAQFQRDRLRLDVVVKRTDTGDLIDRYGQIVEALPVVLDHPEELIDVALLLCRRLIRRDERRAA